MARLAPRSGGWRLAGLAAFRQGDDDCRLRYVVDCDRRWLTRSVAIEGRVGPRRVSLGIAADGAGRWTQDGEPQPAVAGCLDVDLAFTPATNLLPIRRLELPVGGSASVAAAWLTLPELRLRELEQRYRRSGPTRYEYEAPATSFRTSLTVTPSGLVADYPGLWRSV